MISFKNTRELYYKLIKNLKVKNKRNNKRVKTLKGKEKNLGKV